MSPGVGVETQHYLGMGNPVGTTCVLTLCAATTTDEEAPNENVLLSGLYDIEEYHPYEPSAYVWSPCFTATLHIPEGAEWRCANLVHRSYVEEGELTCKDAGLPVDEQCLVCRPRWFAIDEDELMGQIAPVFYGERMADDRLEVLALEEHDSRQEREIYPGAWRVQ